jgi:putative ATP-binding cassette transporter
MTNQSSGPASGKLDRVSAWSLIRPYWISEERRTAWGLLIAIIAMDLLLVGINARLNTWYRDFYDALESKNVHEFPQLVLMFAGLAFASITIFVYNRYLRQMLGFRWRQWLTTRYLQEWLDDGTFYRIERDRLVDNPDQRIAVDLDLFATTTLSLTLDLLSTVETLVWFSIVLWSTAGALVVMMGGTPVQIQGYMLWAAIAYAIVGSFLTNKVGHPLVSINYQLQRVEADFRFGLIRLRGIHAGRGTGISAAPARCRQKARAEARPRTGRQVRQSSREGSWRSCEESARQMTSGYPLKQRD